MTWTSIMRMEKKDIKRKIAYVHKQLDDDMPVPEPNDSIGCKSSRVVLRKRDIDLVVR